jgi:hypothetical protein
MEQNSRLDRHVNAGFRIAGKRKGTAKHSLSEFVTRPEPRRAGEGFVRLPIQFFRRSFFYFVTANSDRFLNEKVQ